MGRVSRLGLHQRAVMQSGSELEVLAGEQRLALALIELKRLGIGEQDGCSVDHGDQPLLNSDRHAPRPGTARKTKWTLFARW